MKLHYFNRESKLFRTYQFDIVKTCLSTNTLVCLPTGLGKTLIASMIMFNIHKWFNGKIFFFAPTKPLVTQQKKSFTDLFPQYDDIIAEITGDISRMKRDQIYRENTFFFLTPQTFNNDLIHHLINCNTISLLIFDEAHKAQKNYAYATIIQKVFKQSPNHSLRIIGLSASPGSSIEAIQNVINSLRIKRIEFRTEKDADITPYIFNKKIIIEEIEMSADINKIQLFLEEILEDRQNVLQKYEVITKKLNPKYMSIKALLDIQKSFRERKEDFEHLIGHLMIGEIYQTLSVMFQVLNCKKKLISEGIESFREGIKKIDIKPQQQSQEYNSNSQGKIISASRKKYNTKTPGKASSKKFIPPYSTARKNVVESLPFKSIKQELENYDNKLTESNNKQFHPKLIKLKQIMLEHKDNVNNGSKVIIFTEYKDSTVEIRNYLQGIKDFNTIAFEVFTGQGPTCKRSDQMRIMKRFRDGEINVLIATSVAEEGLDIGEVDLIICYDINTTSPIKMIQRFGRTGRKRNGLVIVIAAKGEEKTRYYRSLHRINNLYSNLKGLSSVCANPLNKISLWGNDDNILTIPRVDYEDIEEIEIDDMKENKLEDEMTDIEEGDNEEDEDNDDEEEEGDGNDMKMPKTQICRKNNHSTMKTELKSKGKATKNVSFAKPDPVSYKNDIMKFFNQPPCVFSSAATLSSCSKNGISPNPKVLLSFKIGPHKTDSGSKFKVNSCQRLSLKAIPELNLDNSIMEDGKGKGNDNKVDCSLQLDEIDLEKIMEEIGDHTNEKETNKSLSLMIDNKENIRSNGSNQKKRSMDNQSINKDASMDFLTEDVLQQILVDFDDNNTKPLSPLKEKVNDNIKNIMSNSKNKQPSIKKDRIPSFGSKRNFVDFKQTQLKFN